MAGARRTVTVRLPEEMRARIDEARGRTPREPWIRDAIEHYLSCKTPTVREALDGPRVRSEISAIAQGAIK